MTDLSRRDAAVTMATRIADALEMFERARHDAARALPAGHAFLNTLDDFLPMVRVIQKKAEQALARVPA